VLWSGEHKFPGTAETLDMLRKKGMCHGRRENEYDMALTGTSQANNSFL
jgi:hypothetical protein